ncbi:hypothetical protein V6N11_018227 [Hibiscus sabdariffa]|uniref:NAC domain-containing protein n=1 Tax=Hibiscus sabdariffa TaxID=183260 RepID=A0ABR2T6R4_9ROSI
MMWIPPGFRFLPTKEEILVSYLKPLCDGYMIHRDVMVPCNIYGADCEPWKIFDKDSDGSFWIFTKLNQRSKSRIDRTAGDGCWHGRRAYKVKNKDGELIGYDKYFTYSNKKQEKSNGHWIMHEFSLKDPGLNDFVICEIRNKEAGAVATEKRVHVRDEETPDSNHVPSTKKACIAGNQQVGFSNQVSVSPDLTASSYHQTNTLSKASVHQNTPMEVSAISQIPTNLPAIDEDEDEDEAYWNEFIDTLISSSPKLQLDVC